MHALGSTSEGNVGKVIHDERHSRGLRVAFDDLHPIQQILGLTVFLADLNEIRAAKKSRAQHVEWVPSAKATRQDEAQS
jgi:hypothetical protein